MIATAGIAYRRITTPLAPVPPTAPIEASLPLAVPELAPAPPLPPIPAREPAAPTSGGVAPPPSPPPPDPPVPYSTELPDKLDAAPTPPA